MQIEADCATSGAGPYLETMPRRSGRRNVMAARNAFVAALVVLGCSLSFAGESPAPKNVLFLVTSEAFAHGPTVAQGDKPCLAEQLSLIHI